MAFLSFGLGIIEIGVLVLTVLFLFGGPKIKEMVKTFGQEYKKANDVKKSFQKEIKDNFDNIINK